MIISGVSVNYYYAVYGTGDPLLLLHGGLGQIELGLATSAFSE